MATITLEYDARNSVVKKIFEVLFSLGVKPVDNKKPQEPNSTTKKAIDEARKGRVIRCGGFDDYKKELEK
ncbi:MAG: hypothetical protein MJ198_05145 [Bacteroidales bacterium]|nr:hypothetical protein [Bacteroidales bacterium]